MEEIIIDAIDQLTPEVYCKEYEKSDMPWGKAGRALFNEALDFVFGQELPENGKCIEIGVYKGESFLKLVKKYGLGNCIGIDAKNYANLPNIIATDIRKFNEKMQVKLGINDVSFSCPSSKRYAHNWLYENLVKNGIIVLTGPQTVRLANYKMDNLRVIYLNNAAAVFRKIDIAP